MSITKLKNNVENAGRALLSDNETAKKRALEFFSNLIQSGKANQFNDHIKKVLYEAINSESKSATRKELKKLFHLVEGGDFVGVQQELGKVLDPGERFRQEQVKLERALP